MTEPAHPRTQVRLLDGHDPAAERQLLRAGDVERGVVVVAVSPITQGLGRLAGDVLAALGKDSQIAPHGRTAQREAAAAHDWLIGHRIGRVVFAYADVLDAELLRHTADLVTGAGAEACFVVRTARGALAAAAALERPVTTIQAATQAQLALTFTPAPPSEAHEPPKALAEPGIGAAPADPARAAAISRLRAVTDGIKPRELVAHSHDLLGPDWSLTPADPARAVPRAWRAAHVDASFSWQSLRRYRDTRLVAAMALTAVGLSVVEMLALRATNVDAHGGAVGAVDDVLPVPAPLRPFLCARLATVARLGVEADPLLLADRPTPMTPHLLRTMVSSGYEEVGVLLARLEVPYRADPGERWLSRHGLRLEVVGRPAAVPRLPLMTRAGQSRPSFTYRSAHKDRTMSFFGPRRSRRADPTR